MKNLRISLLLLISLHVFQTAHASLFHMDAHGDTPRKSNYRVWIHNNDGSKRIKGFVYQTTDTSLVLVKKSGEAEKQSIPIAQISKVSFRRVNNPWICALAGAGISAIIGGVWGYSDGDSEPNHIFYLTAPEKATLGAILLFPVGLVVGFGLGFIKKRRKLAGNIQNYERERAWIQRFTLTRQ